MMDRSSIDRSSDDLDLAVELLGESSLTGRLEPPTTDWDGIGEDRPEFGVSILVATVALTGGYRLVLREPVSRRDRWWSHGSTTW